jgi:hypothetical protein
VQRPAELADQPILIHVHDLADERSTMAMHTAVATGAESTHAVAQEGDLQQGVPVASEGEHGLKPFRRGDPDPSH